MVQNGSGDNHAMTGRNGQRSWAVRPGSVNPGQSTYLQVEKKNLPAGDIEFWYWPNTSDELLLTIVGDRIEPYETTLDTMYLTQNDIDSIVFPASHPNTIAVGASTNFDYRADYSRYGTGIDFVAPGGGNFMKLVTTDRTGYDGRDHGKYEDKGAYRTDGQGTSLASPLAAGVAALMLSKNPDLTATEIRSIMRETCKKVDSASVPYDNNGRGWNQYYGYGRINADSAVAEAIPTGRLSVTINPQAARNAGARWRRSGTGTWLTSGSTEDNVPTGNHIVQFKSISGWTTAPNRTVTINDGQTAATTGTYVRQTLTISGQVLSLLTGSVSGVTISWSNGGGSTTTNSSGYYSFTVPYGWSGTVTPSKSGYTFFPRSRSFSNVVSNQSQNFTPSRTTLTISGYVQGLLTGGVSGVTISWSNGGGSTTTNSSGYFSFAVPYGWSGFITPSKSGYTFTPRTLGFFPVTTNQAAVFTTSPITLTISGSVRTLLGGVSGVTISWNNGGSSATTNSSGGIKGVRCIMALLRFSRCWRIT